ncbi:MAG: rod-binding protein [Rhodospirillaceae bacterium]|nr:rod-binding protein [Rhodospirillaceae bacterium]
MDAAASLLDNARDAYATGLSAQVAKKTGHAAPSAALPGMKLSAADEKKAREAGKDFEAFFIGQMMEHMMAGIETDPTFGGGPGEDMWRSMLNQEYGKELAKSGKLGIADHVMRGMLLAQEQRDQGTTQVRLSKTGQTGEELQTAAQPVVSQIRR